MAKGSEIPKTDSAEIEILIERLKQNKLEQRDVELIERLLRTVMALVNLLQRKNMSIKRLRDPIFGRRAEKRKTGSVTPVKILSCLKEDREEEAERRATNTSGIVVKTTAGHMIALYASGRRQAGENLDQLPEGRDEELGPPIQMADALAANWKGKRPRIAAKCWAHALGVRRQWAPSRSEVSLIRQTIVKKY
jgi:hypothetical protein